jgi:hypothetical protein
LSRRDAGILDGLSSQPSEPDSSAREPDARFLAPDSSASVDSQITGGVIDGGSESGVSCSSDVDCPVGLVCGSQWPTCARVCKPGCRTVQECKVGEICATNPLCDDCGCDERTCMPAPTCTGDPACPLGTVCEFTAGCAEPKKCIHGCHESQDCPTGQRCQLMACATCPCPGACVP